MKTPQVEIPLADARTRAWHHTHLIVEDSKGRLFFKCKAGCGRVAIPAHDETNAARGRLNAVARARGERAEHGYIAPDRRPSAAEPAQKGLFE